MLTAERLREVLDYDGDTGVFTRIGSTKGKQKRADLIGASAGGVTGTGYIAIWVDGRQYLAHRLAVLFITGAWPEGGVDHRDTDKTNNRWGNLRACDQSQNSANSRLNSRNTTGLKGVSRCAQTGLWRARIKKAGKDVTIGRFDSAEDAHEAYLSAAKRLFGEFARAA